MVGQYVSYSAGRRKSCERGSRTYWTYRTYMAFLYGHWCILIFGCEDLAPDNNSLLEAGGMGLDVYCTDSFTRLLYQRKSPPYFQSSFSLSVSKEARAGSSKITSLRVACRICTGRQLSPSAMVCPSALIWMRDGLSPGSTRR